MLRTAEEGELRLPLHYPARYSEKFRLWLALVQLVEAHYFALVLPSIGSLLFPDVKQPRHRVDSRQFNS